MRILIVEDELRLAEALGCPVETLMSRPEDIPGVYRLAEYAPTEHRLMERDVLVPVTRRRIPVLGSIAAAAAILVCTRLQYDGTFLATYVETGVRRVNLAEKLRRIPLSFFGKKDLADLTSSIMNDCAVLESSQSHYVEPLFGALVVLAAAGIHALMPWLLSFAAGAMLYVVAEELLPRAGGRRGTCGFLVGFLLMMILDVALG